MTSLQKKSFKSKPTINKQNQSKQPHQHSQIFQNQGIANKFNSNLNNNNFNAGVSFNASTHINASNLGNNLNSTSCNKSKGSRKNSKSTKKYKMSLKQSKDNSHSVSIQRKFSLNRPAKTEPHQNNENQDILSKLFCLKQKLAKIQYPIQQNVQSISNYYDEIKKSLQTPTVSNNKSKKAVSSSLQPLNQIFLFVHQLYVAPLSYILSLLKPFQVQIQRQKQLLQEIHRLLKLNEKIYESMSPEDRQIFVLKQSIRQKNEQIQKKRKQNQLFGPSSFNKKRPSSGDGRGRQNFKKKKQEDFIQINETKKQFIIREEKYQNQEKNKDKTNVFHIENRTIQKQDEEQNNQKRLAKKNQLNQVNNKGYKILNEIKLCENCQHNIAQIYCQTENAYLCNNCDKSHHLNKISNKHKRIQVFYKEKTTQNEEEQNQYNIVQGSMSSSQLEDQQLLPNQRESNLQSLQTADNQKNQSKSMGFSFKLDLGHMGKNPNVGFHDQFYSKLDQFSQSWRNQALKQKRF